jgi:hypothetical protein
MKKMLDVRCQMLIETCLDGATRIWHLFSFRPGTHCHLRDGV